MIKTQSTLILNTDLVKVMQLANGQFQVVFKSESGIDILNKPHSADLNGLIGSLTLAIDALAGKIWLQGPVSSDPKKQVMLTTIED